MKNLSFIFLLLCCISCGSAQNEPVRPGDRSDFFIGRWELKKYLYEDQVLVDVSDSAKPFRDSVIVYAQKGMQLSQDDSVRIMNNINQLLSSLKENTIEFKEEGKIVANVVTYNPKGTPITRRLEGIYEVDYHKLRIELSDELTYEPNPAGAFIWFYKNGELLLYRNYQRANESCDVYERAD